MHKKIVLSAAILAAVVGVQPALAGGASGETIGLTCNGCHGTDGKSKGAAPPLYGRPAENIKQAMLDFKTEKRPATIMNRIAKGYSDEELAAVAQYYAELK